MQTNLSDSDFQRQYLIDYVDSAANLLQDQIDDRDNVLQILKRNVYANQLSLDGLSRVRHLMGEKERLHEGDQREINEDIRNELDKKDIKITNFSVLGKN